MLSHALTLLPLSFARIACAFVCVHTFRTTALRHSRYSTCEWLVLRRGAPVERAFTEAHRRALGTQTRPTQFFAPSPPATSSLLPPGPASVHPGPFRVLFPARNGPCCLASFRRPPTFKISVQFKQQIFFFLFFPSIDIILVNMLLIPAVWIPCMSPMDPPLSPISMVPGDTGGGNGEEPDGTALGTSGVPSSQPAPSRVEVVRTKRHCHGFLECEPGVWLVMVLTNQGRSRQEQHLEKGAQGRQGEGERELSPERLD